MTGSPLKMRGLRAPIATIDTGVDGDEAYRLAIYRRGDTIEIAEEARRAGEEVWGTHFECVEIPIAKFHEFLDGLVAARAAGGSSC